jgi:TPR repeat protein
MKECPKCGYERPPKDDEIVPATECPRCGVIYEKAVLAQKERLLAEREEELRQTEKRLAEAEEKLKRVDGLRAQENSQHRLGHLISGFLRTRGNLVEALILIFIVITACIIGYVSTSSKSLQNSQVAGHENVVERKATTAFYAAKAAYEKGDYAKAYKEFKTLADQGNVDAQNKIGDLYRDGQGVTKNYGEALKWYRMAAEQGNAVAQYQLAIMYDDVKGVPHDYSEAVKWYRKAAEQGHANAQALLGNMYDAGKGVQTNHAEAVKWYRKAAEQGEAIAQFNLGVAYEKGEGTQKDYAESVKWYSKAAKQGDADAQKGVERLKALEVPKVSSSASIGREDIKETWDFIVNKLKACPYDRDISNIYSLVSGVYSHADRWGEHGNTCSVTLRNLDPESAKISAGYYGGYKVFIRCRDNQYCSECIGTDGPKKGGSSSYDGITLFVGCDKEQANKIARAFTHLIILHGGKKERF